jgi:hypothetical protein
MTKALVRRPRHYPAKRYKGHAGKNGEHSPWCRGAILGTHCSAIIEKGPRAGQRCGLCLDMYVSYRGLRDWLMGPVCNKHFKAEMRRRNAARRRRW